MKKIAMMAASALLSVGVLVGCGSTAAGLKDGTYTGEGQGNNGPMTVSVTIADGKISKATVDEHTETEGIWEKAEEAILPAVVGKTSTEGIDVVSGATNSSNGIIEAIDKALEQAK